MTFWAVWFLTSLGLLTGCASDPAPQPVSLPPTLLQLQIVVGSEVNPDTSGLPSPILLRIYELKESSSFNASDFFGLFNDDKTILSGDLVHKNELILKPGEIKQLDIQPEDAVKSLGVFAAFKQLDDAQWRNSIVFESHQSQKVAIKINRNHLSAELLR